MASNNTITVNDGTTPTPVAHSYSPIRIKDDVAYYDNRAETFQAGRETLQVKMTSNANVRVVDVDLRIPRVVEETINGVPMKRVADFSTVRAKVIVPLTWVAAEAKDARIIMSNLLANAVIGAMVDDGEFVW